MIDNETRQKALELYASGLAARPVAAQLGVSAPSVVRWARDAGILRPRVESGRRGDPVGTVKPAAKGGYLLEKQPGGEWMLQHRRIMSDALGRPLRRTETVHHINGDRADNRIENLQLRQGPHGPGRVLCCRSCGSRDLEEIEL